MTAPRRKSRTSTAVLLIYLLEGRVAGMVAAPSTVEAILRCARSSIVAGGYNGFSYADIAAVVGIRKASIHHHFPTKVDLVRTLVRQYRDEAVAGLAEIERHVADPLEQLRSYAGYWESCIGDPETSYCLCALLATQIPVLPEEIVLEVRAYFRALSAWLTSVLERGARGGALTLTDDAHSEAEALMAAVHGAMLAARAYGDPQAFAAITRPVIDRLRSHSSSADGRT
ncbi:MAG: TetR/AcrR family transcriptional regulator, transcriptional repressor for nem operon [Mycobacterium sp.]|nr:TetR/AcrR family transcriptional regulator, transcriptional repressor for nem operon [Mycobacterium sp.]